MEPDGDQQGLTPGVRLWLQGHGSKSFPGATQGGGASAEQAVSGSSWLGVKTRGNGLIGARPTDMHTNCIMHF